MQAVNKETRNGRMVIISKKKREIQRGKATSAMEIPVLEKPALLNEDCVPTLRIGGTALRSIEKR